MQVSVEYPPDSNYIVVESHYFPCLAYFACLQPHKAIILEAHEEYKKKSYRNRCTVHTANKVVDLSVPIRKGTGDKIQKIKDVEIDYTGNWIKDHWRTILSAYGKTPFFNEFAPVFESILVKKHQFLFDLNQEILTTCLTLLGWNKQVLISERYLEHGSILTDYRDRIHPKRPEEWSQYYTQVPYLQNFGNTFIPNLSIIDLLCNQGTYSSGILAKSLKNKP